MKRILATVLVIALTVFPLKPARADMWGGDLIYLAQILSTAIQQLAQLRQILNSGKDQLDLLKDVNRGINDSLNLYRTVFPDADPGLYRDWDKVQDAIRKLEGVYGIVAPATSETKIQEDTDQGVAEAIALNNSIYDYTHQIDEIGEQIKSYSHSVSPGGAQKLTAQTLGVMLHVMNQSLRAQATGLKVQAQAVAVQNRKDKEFTRKVLDATTGLKTAMKTDQTGFQIPRF